MPAYDQIKAVVRIRIERRKPDPIENEDGTVSEADIPYDQWEEMPIDDKCLHVMTHNADDERIFCINQAAGRILRTDLIKELIQHNEALANVDLDEFKEHMEKEANLFEESFIGLFSEVSCSDAPKVPVFDFSPTI